MEIDQIKNMVSRWKKINKNSDKIKKFGKYYHRKMDSKAVGLHGSKTAGIYAIVFEAKNDIKIYIGQTGDIYGRMHIHLRDLKNGKHFSKRVQAKYNDKKYKTNIYVVTEKINDKDILQEEGSVIASIPQKYRLNKNTIDSIDDIKPFFDRALSLPSWNKYEKVQVNNDYDECWQPLANIDKDGYGTITVNINKKEKKLVRHRVSYYAKTGKHPHLIRHMCGNKKCFNPDHLEEGSIKDNLNDTRFTYNEKLGGNMMDKFEEMWVKYEADVYKLLEWMDEVLGSKATSIAPKRTRVYYWEGLTGVRKKYPEIYERYKKKQQIERAGGEEVILYIECCKYLRYTDERIASMIQSNFGIKYNRGKVQKVRGAFGIKKRRSGRPRKIQQKHQESERLKRIV